MKNNKTSYVMMGLMVLLFISQGTTVFSQNKKSQLSQPKVIQPGKKMKAPSDAILLDKEALDDFENVKNGNPAAWKVQGNKFTVVRKLRVYKQKRNLVIASGILNGDRLLKMLRLVKKVRSVAILVLK